MAGVEGVEGPKACVLGEGVREKGVGIESVGPCRPL